MVVSPVRVLPDDAVVMPDLHDTDRRRMSSPGGSLGRRGRQASGREETDKRPDQQIAKRSTHWPSP
jgi:hypothetical protein